MISEIPLARKSISSDGPVAALDRAEVRLLSVAVNSVNFTLMPKQVCFGGELRILTVFVLAPVRFQMRINKFALSTFSAMSVNYIEVARTHS